MIVLALLVLRPAPTIAELDALVRARNIEGLRKVLTFDASERNPLGVIKSNGAYEVGKFGWQAFGLAAPDGTQYVVLGTKLTSEDVGEFIFRREGDRLIEVPEADALGIQLRRHRFELKFDVPTKRADLVDRLSFHSEGSGAFLLRMSSAYVVKAITDEAGAAVPFQQASGVVAVMRPKRAEATYQIEYGGTVNLPNYAGSITEREATLVNDYWYPMVARQPVPYDISITPPTGWTAIAQGNRLPDANGKVRYQLDLPVVYYSVLAAPFRSVENRIGMRTYRAWSTRLDEAALRRQTELTAPIVDYYAKTFGPWPFPGYGQVDSRQYGGGALEAYSFATYGPWLPSEDAHEPAHTFWGGVINNTYLKSFWNESFAVFSDGLFHRNAPIGNQSERAIAFIQGAAADASYIEAPLTRSGASEGPVASALGYDKGAKVLQMLEQWLGTAEVTGAMRQWVATHPKGQPGEWEDFEKVVTIRNPSKDIRGFFTDWARRPGYAEFDAKVSYDAGAVEIDLLWKGPRFRMPLTVLLRNAKGKDRYETLWIDGKNDAYRIKSARPVLVSIDPWRQTVRKIAVNENPISLENGLRGLKKFVEPAHADWLTNVGGKSEPLTATDDLAGKFFVGSPATSSVVADLCRRAGFEVTGNRLTYRGTTIDLNAGAAVALIDLPEGKRCAVGLGKVEQGPDFGRARLAVVDRLGRFLRGQTEPKTQGNLTYRL